MTTRWRCRATLNLSSPDSAHKSTYWIHTAPVFRHRWTKPLQHHDIWFILSSSQSCRPCRFRKCCFLKSLWSCKTVFYYVACNDFYLLWYGSAYDTESFLVKPAGSFVASVSSSSSQGPNSLSVGDDFTGFIFRVLVVWKLPFLLWCNTIKPHNRVWEQHKTTKV